MAKSSRIRLAVITMLSFLLIVGCKSDHSSEILTQTSTTNAVQPSLTKTSLLTETPTLEPSPTDTPTSSPTDTPTITLTPTIAPGAEMFRESDGAVMVYVPEGEFWMGWDREDIPPEFMENCYNAQGWGEEKCEGVWWEENSPGHPVLIDYGFYIDKNEITNEMFVRYLNTLHLEVGKNYFPWLNENLPEFNLILTTEGWTVKPGYDVFVNRKRAQTRVRIAPTWG